FREAQSERNHEVQYFRYWSLLETIARSKAFAGHPKVGWDSKAILSPGGKPLRIQDQAEEIIFELLRTTMAPRSIGDGAYASSDPGMLLSLQVPIWYQRRNCVAHGLPCLCRGDMITNPKDKMQRCA